MIAIDRDGACVTRADRVTADVAIVGSGPAGAAVARVLAQRGASVVVLEEGPYVAPERYREDALGAMATLYRDLGASLLRGRAPMPFVQGRAVGGTSVVNGAISWRLPRDVHDEWLAADPALEETLPWAELVERFDTIERELHIAPTEDRVAGAKNLLMARAAGDLEHRPIARNVDGCEGLGRCLQGCPLGRKMSMDRSYLADAARAGARIFSSMRVEHVDVERARATGIRARAAGGGEVRVDVRRAVVLAASAVQTPALLLASGLRHGPTGERFQCHPGFSMSGCFDEPVRAWAGATQGHEVIGLRSQGIKLEVLGYDLAIVAMRTKGFGRELARDLQALDRFAHWGAAIRARALGRVLAGARRARVWFDLSREDLALARRAIRVMGERMLAAGARYVEPGVFGWHERVSDLAVMARFEEEAPWEPRAYTAAVTHMFGTCRMGRDPATNVVRPDFRHHTVDRLYVADSSVFPSNTGVNPQTTILALAAACGDSVAGRTT